MMVCMLAGWGVCQDLEWTITGLPASSPGGQRLVGYHSVAMGDANYDGYPDLLAYVWAGWGATGIDFLWVVSGRTGTRLLESRASTLGGLSPPYIRSFGGAGDWNGDGAADFLVGIAGNATALDSAEVRSGIDGAVLWSALTIFPDEVLGNLDVDGDGQRDVIVADEHALNYLGMVSVYAHSGQLLYQLQGGGTSGLGIGTSLCRCGDVDDDSCDDFVMGCVEGTGRGVNVVVSGRTGAYLRYCFGEQPTDALFGSLDRCGDLDGDGYDEFVASSVTYSQRQCFRVFSARTGLPRFGWCVPPQTGISVKVSSGADVDGDSIPDIVVGTGEWVSLQNRGVEYAFSGRDGSQIHRIPATLQSGDIGLRTAVLPSPGPRRNGLVVVPAPNAMVIDPVYGTLLGQISAYRGLPRTAELLGPACPGTLARMPLIGMQSLGTAGLRVHLSGAPSGAPALLMVGLSTTQLFGIPLPLAVDAVGFPGCSLRTSVELSILAWAGTSGIDAGYARVDLPYPVPASGLGLYDLSCQWLVLGGGSEFPGGLTEALRWRR